MGRLIEQRARMCDAADKVEVLFELLFEIVGQVILELLLEGTFRGVARLLSGRTTRALLGATVGVAAGYGGGYWWGSRLTELGRTDPPKSLWVSIGLAALFLTLAVVKARRGEPRPTDRVPGQRMADVLAPWRWSVMRLLGFALLNAAVATGITVGFTPRPLR